MEDGGFSGLRPSLKNPITVGDLTSRKPVYFEIDPKAQAEYAFEEDDYDEEEEEEDEGPVTADPRRYVKRKNASKPFIATYCADIGVAFESFFDAGRLSNMAPVKDPESELDEKERAITKEIVREGNGPLVPGNGKVFIHYVLMGEGESEPFDSTLLRRYPICLDMRSANLIPGMYVAVKSMRLREVAKFWIRHDYGYGVCGCPPRIPAKTDLFCIIEILDIIEEDQLKLIPYMSQEERAALGFEEVLKSAKDLRTTANVDYTSSAYWLAIKKYRRAVQMLEDYGTSTEEEHKQRQELLYTLFMNLAAAYLKLDRAKQACVACRLSLRCAESIGQKVDAKLYYRFAEAKLKLGDTKTAKDLNGEAMRRAPKDTGIQHQKKQIDQAQRDEELSRKMLYTNLGKAFNSNGGGRKDGNGNKA